jgi:hypothetical protein
MSAQHDADRLVHAFLQEGPAELSSPLTARIRAEVHETKQRTGFRPWRNPSMPRTLWIVAPLAAVLVAIGGLLVVSSGRQTPGPSPAPSMVPSPSVGATSSVGPTAYPIAAGEAWIVMGGTNHATLVRSDGTGRHDILTNVGVSVTDPAWSPDGNQLAFEGNGNRGSQLWVVDADGTNLRQLTPTPDGCPNGVCTEAVNPAWSPDGRSIAYVAPQHGGGIFVRTALMVIDVASGMTTEVYGTDQASLARPTWSPDSQSIALDISHYSGTVETSAVKDTVIGVIDLAATDHTPKTITKPALQGGYPTWHPTLDLIVFRTNRVDNTTGALIDPRAPSDLYTIHADGSGLTKVTNNTVGGQIVRAPSWTPDGRILYTVHDPVTAAETVRIVDVDGKNDVSATGSTTISGQGRWRPGS